MRRISALLTFTTAIFFVGSGNAQAEAPTSTTGIVCLSGQGAINVRPKKCKKGEKRFSLDTITASAVSGVQGEPGAPGADGALRIYGDGSAGDVVISAATFTADTKLFAAVSDANIQFRNFTILSGGVLTVPHGTVIRCTENFVNNGTLQVAAGEAADGGGVLADPPTGVAHQAAGQGNESDGTSGAEGGTGGLPVTIEEARFLTPLGGRGGGAGGYAGAGSLRGGNGGGRLTVLARVSITNYGTIRADGENSPNSATGGGAGGVIMFGSPGAIFNPGTITVNGGAGGGSSISAGPGGGGGGGIVYMISPVITNGGIVNMSGGAAGAASSIERGFRTYFGGGGGGACGGKGGRGGDAESPTIGTTAGGPGDIGYFLQSKVDPGALF